MSSMLMGSTVEAQRAASAGLVPISVTTTLAPRARALALVALLLPLCVAALLVMWIGNLRQGDYGLAVLVRSPLEPEGLNAVVVGSDGPAARTGMRLGDTILAIDGISARDPAAFFKEWSAQRAGDRVVLRMRHQGDASFSDVTFTLGSALDASWLLLHLVTFSLVGLMMLGLGAFVALARPADPAARLMLLWGASFALLVALIFWAPFEHGIVMLWLLPAVLSMASLCHLFLMFPEPHPFLLRLQALGPAPLRRIGAGALLLYLIPLGCCVVLLPGFAHIQGWAITVPLALAAGAVLALLRSVCRPQSPLVRAQLQCILWALTVCFLVGLIGPAPQFITGGRLQGVPTLIAAASWTLFAAALAFAMLRYRLFDLKVVVRATVLYPLLSATLVVGYIGVAYLLSRFAATLLGPDAAMNTSVSAVAALAVGALALPLRQRLQAALDRLLFRDHHARRQLAHDATEALGRARPREEVTRFLTAEVVQRLGLQQAWLVLAADPSIPADDPRASFPGAARALLDRVGALPGAVLLAGPGEPQQPIQRVIAVEGSDLMDWYRAGARLAIPLRAPSAEVGEANPASGEDELLGVWVLGGRCAENPFDRDDIGVLSRVAHLAALQLDNQRLHRAELRRARESERDQVKGELTAVVSHELRTPLASLVGFAELLLVRDYPESQRRQFLRVMLDEGRRLTALINDFLDLQRIESGKQSVTLLPVNPLPLLDYAVSALGEDLERPIHLDVPANLPPVLADADRVKQVLTNLLSNARKYSPRGGEIRLEARHRDTAVEFAVVDRGLGIPPEAQPRLFEKFYRVDNSDRREIKGTGLGLAICQRIVEAHGGRIWAESDGPGHGARFAFTLPLARPPANRHDVLVVEDDPGFTRLQGEELTERGYSSVASASAEAALESVLSAPPRAILLDLHLPGMSGEAFLARLRRTGWANIPVIVVTVRDLDAELWRTLEELQVEQVLAKGPGVATAAATAIGQILDPARMGRVA